MKFIKYSKQTGEIVATGDCEQQDLAVMDTSTAGALAAIGGFDDYVDLSTLQVKPKGARPGNDYTFNYQTKVWERNAALADRLARERRERELAASDWTELVGAERRLGPTYQQWQSYRQGLRDVTGQSGYPFTVTWPTKPQ